MELKLRNAFARDMRKRSINRTIMELKHNNTLAIKLLPDLYQSHHHGIETRVLAPANVIICTINRTIMELKHCNYLLWF